MRNLITRLIHELGTGRALANARCEHHEMAEIDATLAALEARLSPSILPAPLPRAA